MSTFKIRAISEIALLAAFIAVSGAFKLPSFIPGSEFQLSAPLAVAICGVFGIKKYLLAGLLASAGGLLLGTQTIFNVLIAMLFRIVVALLYAVLGKSKVFYLLSGPLASAAARLALSLVIGKAVYPLLAAALPGMIFTALTAGLFASVFEKTLLLTKRAYERY
ncbi:hypothetical protein [uncultured Phascolarctobacterium sp.]|uniref:hypothetical protein n=1 Tax=uncultured Phascolarctobacterium sp. TaxID=512296 RepID=UPI0026040A87|nr:hypothetical protein [uncultured Phascolarctobacterium sp.]